MREPLTFYEARRAEWTAKLSLLEKEFNRLGNARLLLAFAGLMLVWFAFGPAGLSAWWIAAPILLIVLLFAVSSGVTRKQAFAARGLRYADAGIARLKDQWRGKGEPGERFRDANHVYSEDLDLFGKASLFELLCTARTVEGEAALAEWLLRPASLEAVTARQTALRELAARFDLREDMALLGEDVRSQVSAVIITRWGARPPIPFPFFLRPLAALLGGIALILILAFFAQEAPFWLMLTSLAVNSAVIYLTRGLNAQVIGSVSTPSSHLAVLALLIDRIEKEKFQAPLLLAIQERLKVGGLTASQEIQRLERLIDWLGLGAHPIVKILQAAVLWPVQIAVSIELWRRRSGPHIGEWIKALGEFEALLSLASLAFERPDWIFPELAPAAQPQFSATQLRHPLISAGRCIANDVALGVSPRLFIVSGSNMSGKSTLLRTIGLNTVLAWAGAPVPARELKISPLQTGASIRTTDSLQDNRSRFFAEITRLRQILDLTRAETPVLFLLDELLSGTNSHDRRIGAAGLIKGLLKGNAVGLLTTHDLALAEIAAELGNAAQNVHFEDKITDGKMEFDYRLRPGVVTHSNALELMRIVGLEV